MAGSAGVAQQEDDKATEVITLQEDDECSVLGDDHLVMRVLSAESSSSYSVGKYTVSRRSASKRSHFLASRSVDSLQSKVSFMSINPVRSTASFSSELLQQHVFSEDAGRFMVTHLERFKRVREDERRAQYRSVLVACGALLQVICVTYFIVSVIANTVAYNFDDVLLVLRCLGALSTSFFLMSLAFFAAILVDFNSFMNKCATSRRWCLLCLLMGTCVQCSEPPYIGLFGCVGIIAFSRVMCTSRTVFFMLGFWLCDALVSFSYIGVPLIGSNLAFLLPWLSCAGVAAVAVLAWLTWHFFFNFFPCWRAHEEDECNSSLLLYNVVFQYSLLSGIMCVPFSLILLYNASNIDETASQRAFAGSTALILPVMLVMLGSHRLRFRAAIRFGLLDQLSKERDGAFLASLMDLTTIEVGRSWWLPRARGEENLAYEESDHRRGWMLGEIVAVEEDSFVVRVGGEDYSLCLMRRNVSSEDILNLARATLRCLDWRHLSIDVLKGDLVDRGGLTSSTCEALARPLHDGEERIDFFVSHSWHDDAESKHEQLREIAAEFIQQHGREPTFWLDHVCIDQANILDGLRTLPVNILSCDKLIVLCGKSYLSRLWCAWEMCTRMSFDQPEVALDSIILRPLEGVTTADLRQRFNKFDILQARCYDPNEEARVKAVVRALGPKRFNYMVKMLGDGKLKLTLSSSLSLSVMFDSPHEKKPSVVSTDSGKGPVLVLL
eukprot:TRINITY_DN14154_c1_g1_i1.p1 TRINITY_DN14154_c1_g1~~TRINITY_DN14154_c1_g1_i1.p1  ORF type:complete len:723 (+),score=64.88 TRINITY_DN14154_c1_g1_i1:27-2195(+)